MAGRHCQYNCLWVCCVTQLETSIWYVVKQRLAWIKMHEQGASVTEVCRHYGISRKTFYKWYGHYRESGRDFHALKDRSRRPTVIPGQCPSGSKRG